MWKKEAGKPLKTLSTTTQEERKKNDTHNATGVIFFFHKHRKKNDIALAFCFYIPDLCNQHQMYMCESFLIWCFFWKDALGTCLFVCCCDSRIAFSDGVYVGVFFLKFLVFEVFNSSGKLRRKRKNGRQSQTTNASFGRRRHDSRRHLGSKHFFKIKTRPF